MGPISEWLFGVVLLGIMVVFIALPQYMARRRKQKRAADLAVGDRVVTIGGFVGTLAYFDPEADVARLSLADGVEIEILPAAISGRYEREPVDGSSQEMHGE